MSPGDSTVLFRALPASPNFSPSERRRLKAFVRKLSSDVGEGRSFTCLITGDEEMRRLNREFLRHDYATDVLSFPGETEGTGLGDIAISAERAATQAQEFGHTHMEEVQILILHGLLHLCGLDHQADRGEMARAERQWRAEFQLPCALIERASGDAKQARRPAS